MRVSKAVEHGVLIVQIVTMMLGLSILEIG